MSEGVVVTLSPHELVQAVRAGADMRLRAILRGRREADGYEGDGWKEQILGAIGEAVAAKALDRFWIPSPELDYDGDIGSIPPKYHVRCTERPDGRLKIKPRDPDDGIFVLVTGSIPRFTVHGWIRAGDGKLQQYLYDRNGRPACWFVPRSALRPMEELQRPPLEDDRRPPTAPPSTGVVLTEASLVEQLALSEYCTVCGELTTSGVCPNAANSAHREAAA